MQDLSLFKDPIVMAHMEEILYIWAKEHLEFKYQQGMNEILAVIIVCLVSDMLNVDS